jgi:hypothetical protein
VTGYPSNNLFLGYSLNVFQSLFQKKKVQDTVSTMPYRQPATLPYRGKVAPFPSCTLMEQGKGDSLSTWL